MFGGLTFCNNIKSKSYKSILTRVKSLFTKKTPEPAIEASNKPITSYAIASIEINKKNKYIPPKTISKPIEDLGIGVLDTVVPDLPKLSKMKENFLKRKIFENKKNIEIFPTLKNSKPNMDEITGPNNLQLIWKLITSDNLFQDRNVRFNAKKLVFNPMCLYTPKQAKVVNFILNDPLLYKNKEVMDIVPRAIQNVNDSNINFALKVLCDHRLDNTFILSRLDHILWEAKHSQKPQKSSQAINIILDKYQKTPVGR